MIALDTNLLVRLIVRDDPEQVGRAAALVRGSACWVPRTVLLETEWVVRAVYGYTPAQTVEALERLVSMENVTLEDHATAALAVEWHRRGLDFADALHLAASRGQEAFATFDGPLRRAAARLAGPPLTLEP